jgi:hypothetical protein
MSSSANRFTDVATPVPMLNARSSIEDAGMRSTSLAATLARATSPT